MYQGASDGFLAPTEDIPAASEDWGIDYESEIAVVTTRVPYGATPAQAGASIALVAGLLARGAAPGALLFPGTILCSGAIAVMNVLLSSLIKRRWPERAGLLIGLYITALSAGAIVASLVSVPL